MTGQCNEVTGLNKLLRLIDTSIFSSCHNQYPKLLSKAIGSDCKTLLDVGCGSSLPLSLCTGLNLTSSMGVDGYEGSISASREKGIHTDYKLMNILDLNQFFKPDSYDCVLLSDVIEHLEKPEGFRLLDTLEQIAKKKVIIFTPNGFLPQEADDNPFQKHISGWTVSEFEKRGYAVTGVHGFKPLRTSYNHIKHRPAKVWERISLLTQAVCEHRPEHAFQILCVKTLSHSSAKTAAPAGVSAAHVPV